MGEVIGQARSHVHALVAGDKECFLSFFAAIVGGKLYNARKRRELKQWKEP